MKIAFFQPYIANWRAEFLERYVGESSNHVIVYDGGFSPKRDAKSVSGHMPRLSIIRLWSWSPIFKFRSQSYPLYFSPALFFSLVRRRPDCVITEGEINILNNISIAVYCAIFRRRFVWWSLGKVRTRRKNAINSILDPVNDFLLSRASCVMARNTFARDYYVSQKGIQPSRVIVAPNSIDEVRARAEVEVMATRETLLRAKGTWKVMLYVGALTPEKRPEDLIQALKIIRSLGRDDVALWFVGEGPERDRLELMVGQLGLEGCCRFWGKVFKGTGDFFLASDIVVVPGLGGLVINHAMIFGRPVVSRLADGTELDLIHDGRNGYLLHDYDNLKLANAVLNILDSDSDSYALMCAYSKEIVEKSWNMRLMIQRVNDCVMLAVS